MIYPWQTAVWQRLQQARAREHLHHALLFSGAAGCGNEAFVQTLAQSLLCLQPDAEGNACGQCRSCQVFAAQAHPDFLPVGLLEDKQAILIEQVRALNHFLGLSRSYSPRRVALIYPAERMNVNAANSLLKSLEEPAVDTHIILLTAQAAALLPTIRSRCQLMHLPVPDTAEALAWLQTHQLQHPPEVLLEAAWGHPLAALELDTTDTLAHRQQWLEHLSACLQGTGNIAEIAAHWEKYDKVTLLDWQLAWLKQYCRQTHSQQFLSGTNPSTLHALFARLKPQQAWSIYDQLIELKKLATHPLNPRAFVEAMLVSWCLT